MKVNVAKTNVVSLFFMCNFELCNFLRVGFCPTTCYHAIFLPHEFLPRNFLIS